MHRNTKILLALLALVFLGALPAFAQPPADNLNGKTIHIYVESDDFNAFYFQTGDIAFKKDSKYNYSLTLTGRDIYQQDFFFTSNGVSPEGEHFKWKFGKLGLGQNAEGRITVAEFKGNTEMWVVVDPAGPVTAPPLILFEAPKVINILNPWATTSPKLIWGGNKIRKMSTTPDKCGWFSTLLLDPAITAGHFAEVNNTETYGKAGLGSAADYDFAALFAVHGKSIWLNTQANSWTPAWPNVTGECQYQMAVTVRDFSAAHPDFDFGGITGDHSVLGVVQNTIGANRKPVVNPANINKDPAISFANFDKWWVTDSTNANTALRSYESCYDIPMSKSNDGAWEYDSYRDSPIDKSFFPAEANNHNPAEVKDVLVFDNSTPPVYVGAPKPGTPVKRNGNFCIESHATFIYQPGQQFDFRGDDDVWVFINDKLVVDLGGVHIPKSQSVNLGGLGLKQDSTYKWDLFYCDRQPSGSSLRIKTSIYFKQQRALYGISVPGSTPGAISLEIWKRVGGTGSCASIGSSVDSVKASNLIYQLLDATGAVVETLENGKTVHGGITIATPIVTVDTSKIPSGSLTPGATYRVVAFEPANQALKVEVPFKVPVRSFVELISPLTKTAKVGELVMVIAGAMENGAAIKEAVKYVPNLPAGLLVYDDAAGNKPLASTNVFTTDAGGFDTLWVTGAATATEDKTYDLFNPPPAVNILKLTFTVPKNKVEFEPLTPPPADSREVPVGTVVKLATANREGGLLVEKAETYVLKYTAGLKVFGDEAMTAQPIASGATLTTEATGLDVLYATADSSDPVTKTYTLEIQGSTKKVTLTFTMPPLDLPKAVSADIYDDDGDGIGDRLAAGYDRDISAGLPKQIGYRWPSSAAEVSVPNASLAGLLSEGKILTYKGKLSADILTAGDGLFSSTYLARGKDSVQTLRIADRIGPIIKSAEIALGLTQDTLRIRFSEAIATAGITAPPVDLFAYKRMKEAAAEQVDPAAVIWNADRTEAALIFPSTLATAPRAGNLVSIKDGPGHIADAQGNTAGSATRFRLITGGKRSDIKTVPYFEAARNPSLLQQPSVVPSLHSPDLAVEKVVETTGRMGHLIKVDLGAYAVKDDFSNVDPSQVSLEYQVSYYTNLGMPVTADKRTISCVDDVFGKDCLTNRGFVFVGWNNTSKDGARVATGAYIARIRYNVKVAGKVMETGGLDQTWGFLRRP